MITARKPHHGELPLIFSPAQAEWAKDNGWIEGVDYMVQQLFDSKEFERIRCSMFELIRQNEAQVLHDVLEMYLKRKPIDEDFKKCFIINHPDDTNDYDFAYGEAGNVLGRITFDLGLKNRDEWYNTEMKHEYTITFTPSERYK